LPASLELAAGDVTPPRASPFIFVAERHGDGLSLSGNVPTPEVEQRILEKAGGRFGEAVSKSLVYASGAPDGFIEVVDLALRVLGRVAGGRVEIRDTGVIVNGVVYNAAAGADLGENVRESMPEGFTLASSTLGERQIGQPVIAQRCGEILQRDLRFGRIEFDGNRAEISSDSYGVLDRISATLERCRETSVEVGAHSDSEGSASRNRDRTQARAEAIVDYLVDAGVKRERLKPVGYGEDNPVADNDTTAGKAANRRIEFSVSLPEGG
jgi:OOP family OmpA-OmpF porin